MKYRLLIAVDVLEFTDAQSSRDKAILWRRFRAIREYPQRYSDYREFDAEGRQLDVHVHSGFAIHFWDDAADRHIKILHLCRADR